VLKVKKNFSTWAAFGVKLMSNAWYDLGVMVCVRFPRKLKQSFLMTSKRAVAAMDPSFLRTIYIVVSLPILVLRNFSAGVPSAS